MSRQGQGGGGGGGGGSDKVMKLSVGGTLFTTTRPTLQTVQGSFLCRIATGQHTCPKDDRGNFVIDRDGHCFRFVLNYLRTNKLITPFGYRELDILREEADYYGLPGLVSQIDHVIDTRKKRARGRRWNGAAKKLSSSVGENLHNLHLLPEEMTDDFIEDSYFGDYLKPTTNNI